MQRTSFVSFECPAARALESVGDWWSILIIRDAFQGLRRFDQFQESLGIAPNILSRRLKHLAAHGLLERRPYGERPARYEYRLTAKARDFFPVMMALFAWGNRHLPEEERAMRLGSRVTGEELSPIVVDARTGEPIVRDNTVLLPGPAATDRTFERIRMVRALSATSDQHPR